MNPKVFLKRRWRWASLVVLLGMAFLVRLGFWQLDRLEWRRGLNAQTVAELARDPLSLNDETGGFDLTAMHNRRASAAGTYDFERQFVVESQNLNGRPGRFLLTPLRLDGRDAAVLVNRGWIPVGEEPPAGDEREVRLQGYIQEGETLSGDRPTLISAERTLFRIDVTAMGAELPYPVLPIYFLPEPPAVPPTAPPLPVEPDLSLDEGDHLSYAIQWFSFAPLLALIFAVYVYRQEQKEAEG